MRVKRDEDLIRNTNAVLQELASKMGENELHNAVAREAQFLIARGEALITHANPHVENREDLVMWAQDCRILVQYISPTTVLH